MKGLKFGFIALSLFSLFLIILLNSNSVAKINTKDVYVDSKIYEQLKENDMVTVIVELLDGSDSNKIEDIKRTSNKNIDSLMKKMKSSDDLIYRYDTFNSLAISVSEESLKSLIESGYVKEVNSDQELYIQLQQSLPLINATQAWNVQTTGYPGNPAGGNLTGTGLSVCVIDTGIDYTNPALGGAFGPGNKVIGGYDFVNNDADPKDDNGHGTHVAGIVAANGVIAGNTIKGVAPNANLIAVKSCNATGSCSISNTLAGINHCVSVPSNFNLVAISMSIGDGLNHAPGVCPTVYNAAINTAHSIGIPVVVSSGNQGYKTGISAPACAPNATSVGVTYDSAYGMHAWGSGICSPSFESTSTDKVACASNSGPNLDLMAPGARILSTASSVGQGPLSLGCGGGNGSLVANCSGTSMAAAHVSGAIVLIKQKHSRRLISMGNNSYTSELVEKILKHTGKPVTDNANNLTFPRLTLNWVL